MKKVIVLLCLLSFILSGCQDGNIEIEPGAALESESNTVEENTNNITDENIYNETEESEYISRTLTKEEFSDYKKTFIELYCNDASVIGLTEDGNVITWGNNYNGRIGNGKIGSHVTDIQAPPVDPFIIDFNKNIIEIGCSYSLSYAITSLGEVYMWGYNGFGETGLAPGSILEPRKLDIEPKIEKVASGLDTNLFLTADGDVLISGIDIFMFDNLNDYNENVAYETKLGSDGPVPIITAEPGYSEFKLPFKCKDMSTGILDHCFLSETGEVYIQGTLLGDYDRLTPNLTHNELYKIDFPEEIIDIESGSNFIVALSASGKMYLYGKKESVFFNEASDEEISENIFIKGGVDNITSISCHLYCVAMVDSAGNAWGFGIDNWGSLDEKNIDTDTWTYEIITQPRKFKYGNVVKCAVGTSNSVIITENGQPFIQGADGSAQSSSLS